jgi:hypothetical protein
VWFSWSRFDTSISFVGTATKLLKMWLYKTAVAPGEQEVSVTGIFSQFVKVSLI